MEDDGCVESVSRHEPVVFIQKGASSIEDFCGNWNHERKEAANEIVYKAAVSPAADGSVTMQESGTETSPRRQ